MSAGPALYVLRNPYNGGSTSYARRSSRPSGDGASKGYAPTMNGRAMRMSAAKKTRGRQRERQNVSSAITGGMNGASRTGAVWRYSPVCGLVGPRSLIQYESQKPSPRQVSDQDDARLIAEGVSLSERFVCKLDDPAETLT